MKEEIQKFFRGEVMDDEATLLKYSKDASLLTVKPKLVVWPKDAADIEKLVAWAGERGESVTVRAAGSCMSGGPLNEGIIADVVPHMNKLGEIKEEGTVVEPGLLYRDFEVKTLEKNLILPCYPASKNLCALGGQIGNNGAGEKTLRWGKMENYVLETDVIFSDGKKYHVKPLDKDELENKKSQNDFEGHIYRELSRLVDENKEVLENAKPKVSKNSAGYYLWNLWQDNKFDLNRLIVGSQGTLGIVTEAKIKLVPVEPVSKLEVIFMNKLDHLAEIVNEILPTSPSSIESYDDATLKLALRFLPEMLKSMKAKSFLKLLFSFIPEAEMVLRGGIPKLVVLVEYEGKDEATVDAKLIALKEKLKKYHYAVRMTRSVEESDKYWTIRRESFNLLRKHVANRRTAPFVDDVIVRPEFMPEFLPRMRKVLDDYKLLYTIAGHAGNGNFHIIPLMDMRDRRNVEIIKEVSDKIYDLVHEFNGSITAEHNDGIIRTPYLSKMYSPEVLELFKRTKDIFDPKNILNPGKKVGCTVEYLAEHITVERK